MESYYSCNRGYAQWNPTPYQPHDLGYDAYQSYGFCDAYYGYEDPSPPYPPSQKGIEEVIQLLCQERKEIREIQEQIANQTAPLNHCQIQGDAFLLSSDAKEERTHFLNHGPINGEAFLLYTSTKKERRTHGFLNHCQINGEAFRLCSQEGMHECLEEVEEENNYQEAKDVDQEVEHKDRELKGIESVHFASSEATPPMLPSELHFKWVNPYDMNCLGPLRYGLIGQKEDGLLTRILQSETRQVYRIV
ncbi:hypothetical protein PIB30_079908 [Stylosanthes scabra]|uniref:Uncharacterized protein n=1 Tax=Stylosanthes scabra TaxID=79078 RepID=A0ABU6VR48_9FABA|nr:hypothetical protein [Stylosanthes scabra]